MKGLVMLEKIEKFQVLTVGVLASLALVICAKVVTSAMAHNVISVTGSAYEIVKSDSGTLNFTIETKRPTKSEAYSDSLAQIKTVKEYLASKGIKDIELSVPNGYYSYKRNANGYATDIIDYYNQSQAVTIKSDNVELIKEISVDIQSLINKGVDVSVNSPSYNYSKLPELKISLLEKASTDAKNRAASMLKATHNSVGKIQSVRMGVYQITPVDSTDVSDYGINDNTSIDKKVTAVANISFRIK